MSASAEVLKQFLVSLGFKVDEAGAKKFSNQLSGVSNFAMTAGKTIAGVAVAAEAMVTAFAFQMEKLYYVSKRTGSSVENIKGLEQGFARIGLKAEGAQQALESVAAAVRTNPGIRGMMDMLTGKDTVKMDQTDAVIELVKALSAMPHYQSAQYASMFGMDEKTLKMLVDGLPELIRYQKEYKDLVRSSNIDMQQAAEASKEYANGIREITSRIGLLKDKISIELLPVFKSFNGLLAETLDRLLKVNKTDARESFDEITHYAGLMAKEGFTIGQPEIDEEDAYRKEEASRRASDNAERAQNAGGKSVSPAGAKQPRGIRNNNPGNLEYRGQRGAAREAGNDSRFAKFNSMQDGLAAMSRQLLLYGSRGVNSVAKIIGKWAPANENDTNSYIGDVSKQLGVNPNAKLNLRDPNVRASLMSAITKRENGYNPIGSSEILAAAQSRAGGGGVVINQETNINVAGGTAREAANEVLNGQGRVNSNLVRNARGATS